jgi:murein L,D-transpeptidase YcbB/YkuD
MPGWNLTRQAASALLVVLSLVFGISAQDDRNRSGSGKATATQPVRGDSLREIVGSGRLENLRWPNFSNYRAEVERLYRESEFNPVWIRHGQPTSAATQMIRVLQGADNDGLRAEDYDASRWPERLTRLQNRHSNADEARFDVALTVCTMRYVSDLRIGRVNPQHFNFSLDVRPKGLDLPNFVRTHLAGGTDVKRTIAGIEPPLPGYRRLRTALVKYMQLAKQDKGEPLPIPASPVLPGKPYDGISRLSGLLRLLGDLPDTTLIPQDSQIYDGPLVEAVQRFQQRHGLTPDGRLDSATIDQLNVPLRARVEQIRVGLERYRWLHYNFSQPPVIVNIPEFRLYALDKDNKVALTMTVDVGQEYNDTRTPVLESNIEYLIFRPYWEVPLDIQKEEIVPNLEQYSDYLSAFEFEVVAPNGKVVTDGEVSGRELEQIRSGKLHIRQKPGRGNSLGLVKFVFPNRYDVYLHDTPVWAGYFADPRRNISHGCVHVQHPAQLAAWMLRDKPGWTIKKAQEAMNDGPDNYRVNLTKPQPVLIVYMTAVVHEDGEIHFYRDIYGYDRTLQEALAKGYPHS